MLKTRLPILITITAGIFMLMKFFLNTGWIKSVADELEQWCLVVFAVALILGAGNIIQVNLKIILRRGKDWGYKVILIASMLVVTGAGCWDLAVRGNITGQFNFLFQNVVSPLSASMFALLAFYIASAAFRAFRIRNVRAAILLISGCLVMIGRVPLGAALSEYFPKITDWIMTVPNTAGQRGLIIGAAMGVITTGLRVIFGIEKPYLKGR